MSPSLSQYGWTTLLGCILLPNWMKLELWLNIAVTAALLAVSCLGEIRSWKYADRRTNVYARLTKAIIVSLGLGGLAGGGAIYLSAIERAPAPDFAFYINDTLVEDGIVLYSPFKDDQQPITFAVRNTGERAADTVLLSVMIPTNFPAKANKNWSGMSNVKTLDRGLEPTAGLSVYTKWETPLPVGQVVQFSRIVLAKPERLWLSNLELILPFVLRCTAGNSETRQLMFYVQHDPAVQTLQFKSKGLSALTPPQPAVPQSSPVAPPPAAP